MTLQEFFQMGGYAFYVWTSYGIAALVLIINVIVPAWTRRRFLRQQALKQKRH